MSIIIIMEDGKCYGNNQIVAHFMKGVFKTHEPKLKYTTIRYFSIVLKHLSTLYLNYTLSLRHWTHKVLILILLVESQGNLYTSYYGERYKYLFDIIEYLKTSSPSNSYARVEIA